MKNYRLWGSFVLATLAGQSGCTEDSSTQTDRNVGAAGESVSSNAGTGGATGGATTTDAGGVGGASLGGQGGQVGTVDVETYSYTGPGSFYDAEINEDGTFSIAVSEKLGAAPSYTIAGTYIRETTGFLSMTITAVEAGAAADGNPPSVGDKAVALEVPGFALMLKPIGGTDGDIIPMLVSGLCPEANFQANWLVAQSERSRDASDSERDWWGTFEYQHDSPATATLGAKYNLSDLALISAEVDALGSLTCDKGLLQIGDEDQLIANMWLTTGGAMVETFGDEGERQSTIFALRATSFTLADLAGSYAAFVIPGHGSVETDHTNQDAGVGGQSLDAGVEPSKNDASAIDEAATQAGVFPATIVFSADGSGTGATLLDVTTGNLSQETMTLSLGAPNDPSLGWVKAEMTNGEALPAPLVCAAHTNAGESGKTMMMCLGQDPANATDRYTLILVSQ